MKRIILLMITPLIFIIKVNANELFYTKYYPYELDSETYYLETDLLKRNEIESYNTYILKREDIGYFTENNDYLKDENDYIKEVDYYKTKNSNTNNQFSYYKQDKNDLVNKFEIRWYSVSGKAKIDSFEVYYKNNKIYESSTDIISFNTKMIFNLNNYYNINDLEIKITILDEKIWVFAGTLTAYGKNVTIDNKFSFQRTQNNEVMHIKYLKKDEYNKIIDKVDWYKESDKMITGYFDEIIKYKYYQIKKEYLNKYTDLKNNNYYLDLEDKKVLYNYYKRYYLILSDDVNIDDIYKTIIDTNMDISNIEITIKENENNYLVSYNYLDDKIVKKYSKPIIPENTIDNNDISINNSVGIKESNVNTELTIENNFEENNTNTEVIIENISDEKATIVKEELDFNESIINKDDYYTNDKIILNKKALEKSNETINKELLETTKNIKKVNNKKNDYSISKNIKLLLFLFIILLLYKNKIVKRNRLSKKFKRK